MKKKTDELILNANIVYSDGVSESFDALRVTDKGVIIGRIIKDDGHEEFIACGFIPLRNIKKITNGSKSRIR